MVDFRGLLSALVGAEVELILVGGVAATLHGSSRLTTDVDVVYRRSSENLKRIVAALAPHEPYLRGAPPGLPFRLDVETLRRGLNFTLTTKLGSIDLLGEIGGGGTYETLIDRTISVTLFGLQCRCIDLDALIEAKRAAGRPKDLEVLAELEAIREETERL
ncbi:MAG TPA: hypothetical protein VMT00_12745 [Thermoanaerobaculia bacterium]|nr:hypothetical protein [Thermoanaerobaculia bacterium]